MKRIKKIGKAVAGSALLVGATLAGAATMGAASSHNMDSMSGSSGDLGDYPHPFVNDDGEVDSTVVVGENAKTVDVVGALNIAGSLGNAAFETTTQTVGGTVAGSWTATNGVTLDTRNDDLFFNDVINNVRDTLTSSDLTVLEDKTFRDDGGTSYDIEQYLNVDNQSISFGNGPDGLDNEDPIVHIPVPTEGNVDNTDYVISLQANMDEINMTDSNVKGEDIEFMGKTFTVSNSGDDNSVGDSELVLFGSSQSVTLGTGESTTVTIDGNEHTLEVNSVNDATTAAITVDGEISTENTGDTISLDSGNEVRVDEIINTGASDDGQGQVQFDVGSEKLKFDAGNPIQDKDDDDVEGTYVEINGGTSYSVGDGVSSIEVYLGSSDDDQDYLAAGDMWSHSMFPDYEVHVGGLNPDAMETGDNVEGVEFEKNGNSDATVSFEHDTAGDTTVNFIHNESNTNVLGDDDDGDNYVVAEGNLVTEDDYVAVDAGDFDHMYEVTNIDRDRTGSNIRSQDEAEIDLKDVSTGNTVTADLDSVAAGGTVNQSGDEYYSGTEIIDGQTYYFTLEGDSDGDAFDSFNGDSNVDFRVTWGTAASESQGGSDIDAGWSTGGEAGNSGATGLYAPLDTASGSALAFHDQVSVGYNGTVEVPTTQSTDAKTGSFVVAGNSTTFTPGQVQYNASDLDADGTVTIAAADSNGNQITEPAVIYTQPEDDGDNEHAFVIQSSGYDGSDNEYDFDGSSAYTYTGTQSSFQQLDSDNDIYQRVTQYGSLAEQEQNDPGYIRLHVPHGQSTAGVAVTENGGSLSAEGGGSGSVDTMSPTGWDDHGALDSDSDISSMKQNQNLVLVGGPNVNNLVSELADDNKTWSASDYSQGDQVLDLVHDAFSQDNDALVVAGYSGQDTRAAANYISNYEDHESDLSGETTLNLATQ